jgi:adenine deaminase
VHDVASGQPPLRRVILGRFKVLAEVTRKLAEESIIVSGNVVDVLNTTIYPAELRIEGGRIADITTKHDADPWYILPGFIDAHLHVESSMLTPSEFARAAVMHGTVAAVCDPHEIANVLGTDGVRFMLEDAAKSPFRFCFGAPSCVPASPFETSGAILGAEEVSSLLARNDIGFLGEVMNVPAVLRDDPDMMAKIDAAKRLKKPIDGHCPGLSGSALEAYVAAGISTDHECVTLDEALEKLALGMKILMREGSAAKNLDHLLPLFERHSWDCMFCSDDAHPDDLYTGHINRLVKRAVRLGVDFMKVLRAACVNPVLHYGLDAGLLRRGDRADFIVVNNMTDFGVLATVIGGYIVAENGMTQLPRIDCTPVNRFVATPVHPGVFALPARGTTVRVIEAADSQINTGSGTAAAKVVDGHAVADPERDLLKIAVINRYEQKPPAVAFIRGFGLKRGAIASSVAHDAHNIVCVGTSDEEMARAVNLVIEAKGGLSAVGAGEETLLPLPVAGLMSDGHYAEVARTSARLNAHAGRLGSTLRAPFMTLSFMCLTVIPSLKLSDRGLFDGEKFEFTDLFL